MMNLSRKVVGRGPDLVLLHGWGSHSGIWDAILPELAADFCVTLIDLPGHGRSPVLEQNTLSDWITALMQVAPRRAVWMGWSLGGMLAMAAGCVATRRIKGVLTVGSSLRFIADHSWPDAVAESQLQQMAVSLVADPVATLQRFVALQFLGTNVARDRVRQLQDAVATPPSNVTGLLSGLDLLCQLDNRPCAAALVAPLAMIFGENDRLVPVAVIPAIEAQAPDVAIEVVAGAGHAPFLSHPQQFLGAALPYLKQYAG